MLKCLQVGRILLSFRHTFHNNPKSPPSSVMGVAGSIGEYISGPEEEVRLRMSLDVREEDGKGGFQSVPKDKGCCLKLRRNVDKKVILSVQQVSLGAPRLKIERCFGLLLGTGRYLKDSDMTLLEIEGLSHSAGSDNEPSSIVISGSWVPSDPGFQLLNTETSKVRSHVTTASSNCALTSCYLKMI